MTLSFEQFKKEYREFMNNYGGYDIRKNASFNKTLEETFNIWKERHADLINILGGYKNNININLKREASPLLDNEITKLLSDFPDDFKTAIKNNVSYKNIQFPYLSRDGVNYPSKTTKYIIDAMKDSGYKNSKELNKFISMIGEAWANKTSGEIDMMFTISCNPVDILRLGHICRGDNGSCFKNNGGSNSHHKWKIALQTGSFVIIGSNNKDKSNVVRAWGEHIFDEKEKMSIGFLTNYYFNNSSMIGIYMDGIKHSLKNLLKIDKIQSMTLGQDGSYHLQDPDIKIKLPGTEAIYFNAGEEKLMWGNFENIEPNKETEECVITIECEEPKITSDQSKKIPEDGHKCPKCGKVHETKDGWRNIDNNMVCPNCVSLAKMDEYANALTFYTLIKLETKKNSDNKISCSYHYARDHFHCCDLDNTIYMINPNYAVTEEGKRIKISKTSAIKNNYKYDNDLKLFVSPDYAEETEYEYEETK